MNTILIVLVAVLALLDGTASSAQPQDGLDSIFSVTHYENCDPPTRTVACKIVRAKTNDEPLVTVYHESQTASLTYPIETMTDYAYRPDPAGLTFRLVESEYTSVGGWTVALMITPSATIVPSATSDTATTKTSKHTSNTSTATLATSVVLKIVAHMGIEGVGIKGEWLLRVWLETWSPELLVTSVAVAFLTWWSYLMRQQAAAPP